MMIWKLMRMLPTQWLTVLLALVCMGAEVRLCQAVESFPVSIRVEADVALGKLKPIWRFFGADEPNYAYMPHGSKLVTHLGDLSPRRVFFRAHNLLCTGHCEQVA